MPKRIASAQRRKSTAPSKLRPAPTWVESNKRVTFHCPVLLEELIEREMRKSGRSKSRVIVDALRQHLKAHG